MTFLVGVIFGMALNRFTPTRHGRRFFAEGATNRAVSTSPFQGEAARAAKSAHEPPRRLCGVRSCEVGTFSERDTAYAWAVPHIEIAHPLSA